MPTAQNTPESGGTTTLGMPSWRREVERMDAAVAAERHQREIARIATALHGDGADGARHVDVRHGADAVRGVVDIEPERVCEVPAIARSLSASSIAEATAGQARGLMKPSTTLASVTVGRVIAEAVAGRSRNRARRLRTDHQQAALVDARDRTAAGAHLGDVDRRHLEHVAAGLNEPARRRDAVAKFVFRRHGRPAVLDDHRLGRRAAHVEDDDVAVAARRRRAGRRR